MARNEPRWHPIMSAVEGPVGVWRMIDPLGKEYGVVRLVRVDGVLTDRAEHAGEHLGYGGSLRLALEVRARPVPPRARTSRRRRSTVPHYDSAEAIIGLRVPPEVGHAGHDGAGLLSTRAFKERSGR